MAKFKITAKILHFLNLARKLGSYRKVFLILFFLFQPSTPPPISMLGKIIAALTILCVPPLSTPQQCWSNPCWHKLHQLTTMLKHLIFFICWSCMQLTCVLQMCFMCSPTLLVHTIWLTLQLVFPTLDGGERGGVGWDSKFCTDWIHAWVVCNIDRGARGVPLLRLLQNSKNRS